MSVIKDSEGKEYIIFNESELYDDNEMGNTIEDFEILQILGKGSYGFVAKIRSKKNKKIYALKQIDLTKVGSEKEKNLCHQEIKLLEQLNNSNINKYYKTIFSNNNSCLNIIMEFMDNGDISGFINAHKKFNKPVREEEIWNILLQSMNALSYIHSKNIIHRDIKPANLFMTNDKTIKLGDFGVSAKIQSYKTTVIENTFNGTIVGTPLYMSPEMINNDEYDQKTDVYSMGCTIYELCFFQAPRRAAPSLVPGVIMFMEIPKKQNINCYSKQLQEIINKMIEIDPKKRPTSEQIREMVRNEYIKTFLKTSSLSSVVRCLYSFPRLTKGFFKIQNNINESKRISRGYLDIILKIQNNINNKFNQFKEILATEYPKLNSDDEIDPRFIVALLLEKMHKELNKVHQIQNNEEQYIITSTFNGQDEDKSNKYEMIDKFVKHFAENFNSIISNLFFGMLKEKKMCGNCNMNTYNFGCFCLLTFDLNEICGKLQQNNNIYLDNLFMAMHTKNKQFTLDDHIYCDRCLSYQMHSQIKQLYSMPNELIISFERGTNCLNKTLINFPLMLDVSKYVESPHSPKKFSLVGCVNRADINGKEHYISFTKDVNSQKWICSDDDKINQADPSMALTYGIPILLFYSSC